MGTSGSSRSGTNSDNVSHWPLANVQIQATEVGTSLTE